MQPKTLHRLNSREYEHELDRKALDALEGTPGLETLVKAFNKYGVERLLRIQYTGSNIKVNKNNYPDLTELLLQAAHTLDLDRIPDFYIQWGYELNAFTAGVEKPVLVLNSGAVDLLSPEELLFVIGHELGHIKSQHVLYHEMAEVLPIIGDLIGSATLGLGSLVSTGVELALLNWQRMSEFTADRAGILACQDADAANKCMVKMAGLPIKYMQKINLAEFLKQAQEFENYNYDTLDKIAKYFSIMGQNHPWTVMRSAELIKWIQLGEYDRIINKYSSMTPVPTASAPQFCPNCGCPITGGERFCPRCGQRLR